MDRDERHTVDAKPISRLEVEAASKHVGLESGLVIEGDDLAAEMAAAPGLFDDSDFGVTDESWADEKLNDERYCD